jgi:hypothetical protein
MNRGFFITVVCVLTVVVNLNMKQLKKRHAFLLGISIANRTYISSLQGFLNLMSDGYYQYIVPDGTDLEGCD